MMRLPLFELHAPKTALEAASILADYVAGEAMLLGGSNPRLVPAGCCVERGQVSRKDLAQV